MIIISKKHPKALGMPFDRVWAEIVKDVEPVFAKAETEGCATTMEDTALFLERHGYVEEYVPFVRATCYQYTFYRTDCFRGYCDWLSVPVHHRLLFDTQEITRQFIKLYMKRPRPPKSISFRRNVLADSFI